MSMSREQAESILVQLGSPFNPASAAEAEEALLIVKGLEPDTRAAILDRIRSMYGEPSPDVKADIAAELRAEIAAHEEWIIRRERVGGPPEHVEAIVSEQRRHVDALRALLARAEAN